MEKKTYTLNTLLAVVLGAALLAARVVATFWPRIILPVFLDVPNLAVLSLVTLVLDHYLAKGAKRCWICIPVLSVITFGLLPYAACFTAPWYALRMALMGGVTFTALTWLFDSMVDRISTGTSAKAAPVVSALCLWLAVQVLMGMF